MSELINLLLRTSLWLALVLGLLVVLRPLLWRLGGAALVYTSWWAMPLVLLAMLIPVPVPAWPTMLTSALPVQALLPVSLPTVVAAAPGVTRIPLQAWGLVWAAGVLVMVGLNLWRQQRFERALGPLQRRADGAWQASTDPGLPALVGLWQPRIVVGPAFDLQFDAVERALVLAHERSHHRHGDHWANAGLLLARCLFWFHPLLPWAARRFVRDQELACDARTIGPQPALRRTYAGALLKAQLVHPAAPMACYWRSHTLLKERIAMLKESKRGRLARMCGAVLAVGVCGGVATLAWASQGAVGGAAAEGNGRPTISAEAAPAPGHAAAAGDQDAVAALMSPPVYPKDAFEAGRSGKVVLRVQVLPDGKAGEITVQSSTDPVFDAPSIAAARQWTFNPALRDGKPVVSVLRVPIDFALQKDEGV